jgi:hypothetical protein
MKNIKKVNTPLYKLIFPWKIMFDTFNIKQRQKDVASHLRSVSHDPSGYITIRFHNSNNISEIQKNCMDDFSIYSIYKKININLLIVNDDCSSTLSMLAGARLCDVNYDKFEIEFYFDAYFYMEDSVEAIPYIGDIKINQAID